MILCKNAFKSDNILNISNEENAAQKRCHVAKNKEVPDRNFDVPGTLVGELSHPASMCFQQTIIYIIIYIKILLDCDWLISLQLIPTAVQFSVITVQFSVITVQFSVITVQTSVTS